MIHKPVCNGVVMLNWQVTFGIGLSWAAVRVSSLRFLWATLQGFYARVSVRLLLFFLPFFITEVLVFIMPFS